MTTEMLSSPTTRLPTEGFFEGWTLRVADPKKHVSLTLAFQLLHSRNGFRRSAEINARVGILALGPNSIRTQLKSTASLDDASRGDRTENSNRVLSASGCELERHASRGVLRNKGRVLEWNLTWTTPPEPRFSRVPALVRRWSPSGRTSDQTHPKIEVSGWFRLDAVEYPLNSANGSLAHSFSAARPKTWTYAQATEFTDSSGNPLPLRFEGMTATYPILGSWVAPRTTTLYFEYRDQTYVLSSVPHFLSIRSEVGLDAWVFEADLGEVQFKGKLQAENREFISWTEEDTDGGFIHVAHAPLTRMELSIFRRGKLETSGVCVCAALEIAGTAKNPYLAALPGSS